MSTFNPGKHRSHTISAVAGIALAIVAFLLRLYRPDAIDFRFDQAYPFQYAQYIVRGEFWGVQPHGSVGQHPAAYLYVLALGYLFTNNFQALAVYRILWDVAAVALAGWLGARYVNGRAGLVAMAMFACAPWAIQFARNFWPVPQPLFSAIALLGLAELYVRQKPHGWAIAGLGTALVAGAHLGGLYAIPAVGIVYALALRDLGLRAAARQLPWMLLGALPGLLVIGLFLRHDASQNFENLRAYAGTLAGGATFSWRALEFSGWLSGGAHLSDLTGGAFALWRAQMPVFGDWIDAAQLALFYASVLACVVFVLYAYWRRRQDARFASTARFALICLLWLGVPVVLQLRSSRDVMLQYLPGILPAPFMLMGIAASWLQAPRARAVLTCALATILCWQVFATLRFAGFVTSNNTPGGYGLPVGAAVDARNIAADAIRRGEADDVIVVLKGFPTPWNEQAAIMRSVLADVEHRWINSNDDGFVVGSGKTQYLFVQDASLFPPDWFAVLRNPAGQVFTPRPGATPYQLWRADGYALDGLFTSPNPVWASRVALAGYAWSRNGSTMTVRFALNVLEPPPDGIDYHWYVRAFDGDRQVAQRDIAGVHPSSWRAGDMVYISTRLELPESVPASRIRLGSYVYPDIRPVMVSIPGQPAEDGVWLPLATR